MPDVIGVWKFARALGGVAFAGYDVACRDWRHFADCCLSRLRRFLYIPGVIVKWLRTVCAVSLRDDDVTRRDCLFCEFEFAVLRGCPFLRPPARRVAQR